jgi:hypothetical protein
MSDEEPKSAYELAMERLREKDTEQGIPEERTLTQEQKESIAEAQRACLAKLAELEIMHKSKVAGVQDAEAFEALQRNYRRDVERATSDRDRTIARIRAS